MGNPPFHYGSLGLKMGVVSKVDPGARTPIGGRRNVYQDGEYESHLGCTLLFMICLTSCIIF